jgi:hypothetical protein
MFEGAMFKKVKKANWDGKENRALKFKRLYHFPYNFIYFPTFKLQ